MPHAATPFAAGQCWTYRAPQGYQTSRLVIGAIAVFPDEPPVLCCSVYGAPRKRPDGSIDTCTIPFLPMTESAVAASVVALAGVGEPAEHFIDALEAWQEDPRGLTTFTVPFEGFLDRMIALQMAEIVGRTLAA